MVLLAGHWVVLGLDGWMDGFLLRHGRPPPKAASHSAQRFVGDTSVCLSVLRACWESFANRDNGIQLGVTRWFGNECFVWVMLPKDARV